MRVSTIVLLAAVVFGAASPASSAPTSSDATHLAVARRMIADWKARDWRSAADLFAIDGALHSMMDAPITGREAIYKRFAALGAGIDSITLDVSHLGVIDHRVYMERVDRFVYHGKPGAVPVVGVLSFDGNKIAEWREYYDRAQLVSEMGANPPVKTPN